MNVILFDDPQIRLNLLPFTFTRPVAGIRVGILTVAAKWEKWLGQPVSFKTEEYLQAKYPLRSEDDNLLINGALCPDAGLVNTLKDLKSGTFLVKGARLLAARNPQGEMNATNTTEYAGDVTVIERPWRIFQENGNQIRADFSLLTAHRKSAGITDPHTIVYGEENVFVEEGVTIRAARINALGGPVYIGPNAIIEEGAIMRGPFAICESGHLNMGAKMRGDTTVGPFSKVGGEVSNSVIFGYSNKAHDGFMGNSVIGEWCNLGADTNTSNLKNDYGEVTVYDAVAGDFVPTGRQFVGLFMGDHAKCSINTMFNTGTVVGVFCNLFGSGFPPRHVPSFSWGGAEGLVPYRIEKALRVAEAVMARRGVPLTEADRALLAAIAEDAGASPA